MVGTYFSILQVPKCRVHSLSDLLKKGFHSLDGTYGYNSNFMLLACKANELEGGYTRRWLRRRPFSTNREGRNKTTQKSKPTTVIHDFLEETVSTDAKLNITRTDVSKFQNIDIRQMIADNKDLAKLVTVVVFDIETTGFSRKNDRIIEIALQDLQGGKNSTFQSLVNPGCHVYNSHIHGITTQMVCNPSVPRIEKLLPILVEYVRSREKPGGYTLLVAHNGQTFDVPFLVEEFSRCSVNMPSNWLFLDTIPLARKLLKSLGLPSKLSLQALRETFGLPMTGDAHRAMSDVKLLSLVLQRLTFDLKIPIAGLVEQSFTVSDLCNSKKNRNSS